MSKNISNLSGRIGLKNNLFKKLSENVLNNSPKDIKDIDSIDSFGEKVGQYNIQNKIVATLNNSQNVNISKIKKDFLTNSSCGVCGKSSLDALEITKKEKAPKSDPKLSKDVIINSPRILRKNQSEFAKTGGIHASGLFSSNGDLISLREDVGRHNALDKMIGDSLLNNYFKPKDQFITCSGLSLIHISEPTRRS